MPDDIAMAVALTVATKAAELTVSGAKNALGRLYRLIRERFAPGTQEATVLESAVDQPADKRRLAALAAVVDDTMARDPVFARQVRSHWEAATVELAAGNGGVVNLFGGSAQKVVQARDIGGDVNF